MKTLAILGGVFFTLALDGRPALGQFPTTTDRRPASSYATAPFDSSVAQLPPNFAGHDCVALATSLKAARPQKDDFETTDAYNQRAQGIRSTPLIGAVTLADTVAFVPPRMFTLQKYDADTKTLRASLRPMGSTFLPMPASSQLEAPILETLNTKKDTYTASNVYGKTVSVDRIRREVCAVAFMNRRYALAGDLETSFPIEPEEARSVQYDLGVLFVGTLVAPYLIKYIDQSKPTVNIPIETMHLGDGIVMTLKQVWLFNRATGKVYARIDGAGKPR